MESKKKDAFYRGQITLPILNPKNKRIFAYDIGGTLFKIASIIPSDNDKVSVFKTAAFSNKDVDAGLEYIKQNIINGDSPENVVAIGLGIGSRIHKAKIKEELNLSAIDSDEFLGFSKAFSYCLLNLEENEYLLPDENVEDKLAECKLGDEEKMKKREEQFPAVIIMAGSGVGTIRIDADSSFTLTSGTALGGACFRGLGRMLTGCTDFMELKKLAENGDPDKVNGLYDVVNGENKCSVNDFFEKVNSNSDADLKFDKADIAASLLDMFINSHVEKVVREALIYKIENVYFCGNFYRNNQRAINYTKRMPELSSLYGINVRARFFNDIGGYLGVIGAIITHLQTDEKEQ